MNQVCCFAGCARSGPPFLKLTLYLPRDKDAEVVLWAHEECFSSLTDSTVKPDDPKDHGSIPKARCVFCGAALPLFGRHPYCFDLGEHSPPRRFWSHAECLAQRLVPRDEFSADRSP